ncbi:MAG: hypothetical protein WC700_03455 [Gemmatimonadaceae bacterium]|jgi:MFS family permease
MTAPRRHTRTPLAVLVSIGFLVIVHSMTQDSPAHFSRTLPFLLMMILGELVREWTVGRLSSSTDEETRRRRRRLGWIAGIAGIVFLTIPLTGLVTEWLPKRSLWVYALAAASLVCLGVLAAVMMVSAQATLNAKRAEAARAGEQLALKPPGPLIFLAVLVSALLMFASVNATVIGSLFAHQTLGAAQWVRVIVSALLCFGLVYAIMRKLNEFADRPFDPANPDLT